MTSTARPGIRRPRATAARQALRLCEADLSRAIWDPPKVPHGCREYPGHKRRYSRITMRAALQAVGIPPLAAAALRPRLRLISEREAEQ